MIFEWYVYIKIIQITKCSKCELELNFEYLDCIHPLCRKCYYKLAEENFALMKCVICSQEISYEYKKEILGKDFQMFEEMALKKYLVKILSYAQIQYVMNKFHLKKEKIDL